MTEDNNLISIIIPTFNRGHLIGETLDSILSQTHTNWECIIVDDGSTDNTLDVLAEYHNKDPRFKWYERPNTRIKGANSCRNYGFEVSKGSYIKWFDSDDIMLPDFLEKQITILKNDKSLDFCICLANLLDSVPEFVFKANRNPKGNKLAAYLVKNHYFFTASPLWRKEFLTGLELFDEDLTDSQETDLHFRVMALDPRYVYTDDVLFSIRIGHDSITQNKNNQISSDVSRLKFFIKAFKITYTSKIEEKNVLMQYIVYRQLDLFYSLQLNKVKELDKKMIFNVLKNLIFTKYPAVIKVKGIIGFFLTLIFGKGYSYIKETKVDIIEVIEN